MQHWAEMDSCAAFDQSWPKSFTCSMSTIETLEVWNMSKVNNKNTRTTSKS